MLGALSGCSGGGPYCDAVDEAQDSLRSFGTSTSAAYEQYAKDTAAIARVAPEATAKQWTQIAEATQGVVDAQRAAGIKLEDMKKTDEVDALSRDDIEKLNRAYEAFNATQDQRKAVVKDVQDTCGIDLAPDDKE